MTDKLGVQLVGPNPGWPALAAEESRRIEKTLGEALAAIHHVGSTAIPCIRAKPTIDLLPIAASLSLVDAKAGLMRELGYEWRGEFGLAGRRYCTLTRDGVRLFNVHIFEPG